MSRWKAAAIHLTISAVIGIVAAILIFGVWYPSPYSYATGALKLVVLLMGVDLVLGPVLTLAVFKAGKRGMKFDLAVIAILQTCAFLYGMSIVTRARPVFVVGVLDRFVLVAADDVVRESLEKAAPPNNRLPWGGPRLVGARLPSDPKERSDLLFKSLGGGDVENRPEYYIPYEAIAPELLKKASPLAELRKKRPEAAHAIDDWLRSHGRSDADVVWLPNAAKNDTTMLMDAATGMPLDAVPIDPW